MVNFEEAFCILQIVIQVCNGAVNSNISKQPSLCCCFTVPLFPWNLHIWYIVPVLVTGMHVDSTVFRNKAVLGPMQGSSISAVLQNALHYMDM